MYTTRILEEGVSQNSIGWMVWVALAIFFIMVILGWLASSRGWLKKEEDAPHESHEHDHPESDLASAGLAHDAHAMVADDLTILEGIGSKVAKVLAGIGITTFAGLASADLGKLRSALDAAGYRYMDPAGWIDQAALAAKGDKVALKKLQDSLKGGRKTAK